MADIRGHQCQAAKLTRNQGAMPFQVTAPQREVTSPPEKDARPHKTVGKHVAFIAKTLDIENDNANNQRHHLSTLGFGGVSLIKGLDAVAPR